MRAAPHSVSVPPDRYADGPVDVNRRDAGASPSSGQYRQSIIERARLTRGRIADLHQRVQDARQRAAALMQETAALLLAAEQIQLGMTHNELLARSEYARLRARMQTMPVIEQAKGILMAQSGCGPEAAFELLRRASQRSNVPVRELAAQIVARTAEAPRAGYWPSRRAS